jgi:diaminohydroxyphosphoribosylaminopyrimidine deaminase/5-amino-6-(5-phosphoribosylamino)uracil reductase
MAEFSREDHEFMARALRLARRGMYTAHPNPRVGCVLVKAGTVVGEGWHEKTGEAHAEINALAEAGSRAGGSTAYVTLEPCSHHGKTPPCSEALVAAGVSRVVYAMPDPNPHVDGLDRLQAAGIDTAAGLMRAAAEALNRGFVSRITRGRPFVTLKLASSLDGATAMASGESQWITGPAARRDVQALRARCGAILTGIGTVLDDDPALTVRDPSIDTGGLQPLRVVLDSGLRLPPAARLFDGPGPVIVLCAEDGNRQALEGRGAEIVRLPAAEGRPQLTAALDFLARRGINDLLVECGPALAGSLLMAGLVDELVIYQAPHIMGSQTRGLAETPGWRALQQRMALTITDVRVIGQDTRITARPAI